MVKDRLSTCSELFGGDSKGLDLQSERVEGEGWYYNQSLLCVAHVGVAHCTPQVVQTGVAD